MAGRFTVKFDDFSGGWAGDVDRSQARKGEWFGQDVMVYTDGLIGPRHPLRKVTLTSPPAMSGTPPRVDEAIIYEFPNTAVPLKGAFIVSGTNAYTLGGISDYAGSQAIVTRAVGGANGALAVDSAGFHVYLTRDAGATRMANFIPGDLPSSVTLSGTSPSPVNVLVRWNDRMVYASRDDIYYSDGAAFTSWPAANVYGIGDGAPITALIAAPLTLYVAKASGWWAVTGVLGSTATIRQVVEHQGVEPAQQGSTAGTTAAGARTATSWEQGILWLRRRANDSETDLDGGSSAVTTAVEASEVMTFTGAAMRKVATIKASRQARLASLHSGAAIVDCQTIPLASAVQHAIYVVGPDANLSRHVFAGSVISTVNQVVCPLLPLESAKATLNGYDADHLWMAFAGDDGNLALRSWRYRASRPGYGSDDPAQQADDPSGTHANVIGTLEVPDYWSPEGRQIKVLGVWASIRKYDNSAGAHYVSTARLTATVTALGVTEQTGSSTNQASSTFSWSELVDAGEGDQDMMVRLNCNDTPMALGFRLAINMEMVAVRKLWVMCEAGEVIA